jgi:putative aminopeptidase FrvX
MPLPKVFKELLSLPAAAFAETAVLDYVRRFCRRLGRTSVGADRYGNLLAHYRYGRRRGPAPVFTAHTDHPAFVALTMRDQRTLRAAFRGGVMADYFPGAKVRFRSDGRWIKAKVIKLTKILRPAGRPARPTEVRLTVSKPIEPGAVGVWDLPKPILRGDRLYGPSCDDIAGVAGMLTLLERLSRKRARAEAYCLFTRAEEVGFIGAIAAARAGTIPKRCPVIAIETSKELPNARIGDGPILRVGDRMSVFTPAVTAFCERVAKNLLKRRKTFTYQRKLMDGGSCESTAYAAYGYPATGICLALGNHHNMDTRRGRIAPEYISLRDWRQMVDWFEAIALDKAGFGDEFAPVRVEFDKLLEQNLGLLAKQA